MSVGLHPNVDSAAVSEILEHYYEQGWTDGLPTVPCTETMLDAFLAHTDRDPAEVVLEMPHLNRACTVRLAAINAVMAGCRADYLPVVLAAWDAVRAEGFATAGMWQSTTGIAPLLVVNGPVRSRIGLNSAGNVFGSGVRANATIGRALRLTAINVFGLQPGVLDQSTQGTPAKYTFCIAENEQASPWPSLHEEAGFDAGESTVTAISMRSIAHVEARHAVTAVQLLHDLAGTVARSGGLLQETTSTCLVLSPEHAGLLAAQGWDKPRVRAFLHENAVLTTSELERAGKDALSSQQRLRLPGGHPDARTDERLAEAGGVLRVLASPEAVKVVVAGAPNCGISAVVDGHGVGGAPSSMVAVRA